MSTQYAFQYKNTFYVFQCSNNAAFDAFGTQIVNEIRTWTFKDMTYFKTILSNIHVLDAILQSIQTGPFDEFGSAIASAMPSWTPENMEYFRKMVRNITILNENDSKGLVECASLRHTLEYPETAGFVEITTSMPVIEKDTDILYIINFDRNQLCIQYTKNGDKEFLGIGMPDIPETWISFAHTRKIHYGPLPGDRDYCDDCCGVCDASHPPTRQDMESYSRKSYEKELDQAVQVCTSRSQQFVKDVIERLEKYLVSQETK